MAKLVRKTQKIFASGSAQNQVTSFGSIKAGAVDYTKDVADIQTEAFEGGWSSAVQDDYAPYRQDRNAVDFVTTSQLAYVFQEGLPEYDAGTTYYRGSWVKGNDGDAFSIYESLSDDNIGNALSDEEKWEKKSFGGGLEIGDIGFAPLGIDETQNKRRYLNGQVISQSQFATFAGKVKAAIALYPSLSATESNWQAEVTNSKLGQCGKFVIDDTAGTIRLPKVVNINGLTDLSLIGGIKAESLPNITGVLERFQNTGASGAFALKSVEDTTTVYNMGTATRYNATFNASRSSPTYKDNAPVQQEAIHYPYFIQVATGSEESVDVSTEIQLNNPFSLFDSKWADHELSNASWVKSNGIFYSGATYVTAYNELLTEYNNAASVEKTDGSITYKLTPKGFKIALASQDAAIAALYNDTGVAWYYVLDTANTQFKLPRTKWGFVGIRNAVGSYVAESLPNITGTFRGRNAYNGDASINESVATGAFGTRNESGTKSGAQASGTNSFTWTFDASRSSSTYKDGAPVQQRATEMYLYFYVGETVQDANVINAAGVLTRVANSIDRTVASDRETVVGWGMPDYSAGVSLTLSAKEILVDFKGILTTSTNVSSFSPIVYINGVYVNSVGGTQSSGASGYYLVDVGDRVKLSTGSLNATLFPLKGVN